MSKYFCSLSLGVSLIEMIFDTVVILAMCLSQVFLSIIFFIGNVLVYNRNNLITNLGFLQHLYVGLCVKINSKIEIALDIISLVLAINSVALAQMYKLIKFKSWKIFRLILGFFIFIFNLLMLLFWAIAIGLLVLDEKKEKINFNESLWENIWSSYFNGISSYLMFFSILMIFM